MKTPVVRIVMEGWVSIIGTVVWLLAVVLFAAYGVAALVQS